MTDGKSVPGGSCAGKGKAMSEAECRDDDARLRKIFGYLLRDHVAYQDGRHSDAPSVVFADGDYEVGDGTCGLHADGKRCNEPAIIYARAAAPAASTCTAMRRARRLVTTST